MEKMNSVYNVVKLADKVVRKQDNIKARELRKALKGNATVIVTLHTGSIYTMVQMDTENGLRFSGLSNGKPGRFHAGMIKDIQTLEQTKEVSHG